MIIIAEESRAKVSVYFTFLCFNTEKNNYYNSILIFVQKLFLSLAEHNVFLFLP